MFDINHIVAVGSVDGILTTGALLRLCKDSQNVGVEFCQAFTVDKIDPAQWFPSRKVAFVDLAVNNTNPAMTQDFVDKIQAAGHEIVAIVDEHDADAWSKIVKFDSLLMRPMIAHRDRSSLCATLDEAGHSDYPVVESSGCVLWTRAREVLSYDEFQTQDATGLGMLCRAARSADMGMFEGVGEIVNRAVKSNIADDSRRVYLARWIAAAPDIATIEPDATIQSWISEYDEILANHQRILDSATVSDGVISVDCTGIRVDMTSLMFALYERADIACVQGEIFDPITKSKRLACSIGTSKSGFDLVAIANATPNVRVLGGKGGKVNVMPADAGNAIFRIRGAVYGNGARIAYQVQCLPEVQALLAKGIGVQFSHRDWACRILSDQEGQQGWSVQLSGHPKIEQWPCGKHGMWPADPPMPDGVLSEEEEEEKALETIEAFLKLELP